MSNSNTNLDLINIYPTKDFLEYCAVELYSTNSSLLMVNSTFSDAVNPSDIIKFKITQTKLIINDTIPDYLYQGTDGNLICTLNNEEIDSVKYKDNVYFDILDYSFTDFDDSINWGTDTGVASIVWNNENKIGLELNDNRIKNNPYFVFERWVGNECNFKALYNGTITAPNFESIEKETNILYKEGWSLGIAYLHPDVVIYDTMSDFINIVNSSSDFLNTLSIPSLFSVTDFLISPGTEIIPETGSTIITYNNIMFKSQFTLSNPDLNNIELNASINCIFLVNTLVDLVAYAGFYTQPEYVSSYVNLLELEINEKWHDIVII